MKSAFLPIIGLSAILMTAFTKINNSLEEEVVVQNCYGVVTVTCPTDINFIINTTLCPIANAQLFKAVKSASSFFSVVERDLVQDVFCCAQLGRLVFLYCNKTGNIIRPTITGSILLELAIPPVSK